MRFVGQFPCFHYDVEQTNVGAPRHVIDHISVRPIVPELVEASHDIVMLNCWCFAVLFAI